MKYKCEDRRQAYFEQLGLFSGYSDIKLMVYISRDETEAGQPMSSRVAWATEKNSLKTKKY